MKTLTGYLKTKAPLYILMVLFALLIILMNWVSDYPLDATIYALVICAVAFIIYESICYIKHTKFMKSLRDMENKIGISIENLPAPQDNISREYTSLLEELSKVQTMTESKYNSRYRDMFDYYTMWAHQIKTPIQAMMLILQEEETETNQELELELKKIEQYVDMVLTFLKLDTSASDLSIKKQPIDPIIKSAVRKNAKSFIIKKISLVYDDLDIVALTDEKWLQFVIEQILSNCLKYTKSGSVTIAKTGDTSFSITDTGIGIASDDLPRVFERGFTGYNGREDKKATGIGLYLCHEILNKLGHKISIESTKGVGTTVTIDVSSRNIDVRD